MIFSLFLRRFGIWASQGLIGLEYWGLIWWVLTRMPAKFAMAITLTVYGYHFRQVAKLHLGNVVEKDMIHIPTNIKLKHKEYSKVNI